MVSAKDILFLLRLPKIRGDVRVRGTHGPDLGEQVDTVLNALIHLIHFDAQHPGVIDAAVGGGTKNPSRAIRKYMREKMDTRDPADWEAVRDRINGDLAGWLPE